MLVFFFCDDGHMISGEPLLQCLDNGTWSQDTPTCVLIDGESIDQSRRVGKKTVSSLFSTVAF